MFRVLNVLVAGLLGCAITFVLFYIMQYLIVSDLEEPEAGSGRKIAQVTIPEQVVEIQRIEPKPEEPDEIEEIPDLPDVAIQLSAPTGPALSLARVEIDLGGLDNAASLSAGDGEFLPIVEVAPQYPQRALSRGIQGWCLVEFTVTENGTVIDPVVLDAEPANIFNSSSTRAVLRFKYNPRVVDGEPVPVPGVRKLFTYQLDDE